MLCLLCRALNTRQEHAHLMKSPIPDASLDLRKRLVLQVHPLSFSRLVRRTPCCAHKPGVLSRRCRHGACPKMHMHTHTQARGVKQKVLSCCMPQNAHAHSHMCTHRFACMLAHAKFRQTPSSSFPSLLHRFAYTLLKASCASLTSMHAHPSTCPVRPPPQSSSYSSTTIPARIHKHPKCTHLLALRPPHHHCAHVRICKIIVRMHLPLHRLRRAASLTLRSHAHTQCAHLLHLPAPPPPPRRPPPCPTALPHLDAAAARTTLHQWRARPPLPLAACWPHRWSAGAPPCALLGGRHTCAHGCGAWPQGWGASLQSRWPGWVRDVEGRVGGALGPGVWAEPERDPKVGETGMKV